MKLPKKYKPLANNRGFTKVGLIVVIVVILLIGAVGVVLPPQLAKAKARKQDAACRKNHQMIALSLHMFAEDHDGKPPWQVSEKDGGSMEYFSPRSETNALLDDNGAAIFDKNAWRHLLALGPTLAGQTNMAALRGSFICPTQLSKPSVLQAMGDMHKSGKTMEWGKFTYWLLTDENLNFNNAKYPRDAVFSVCPHHPDKSYIASTADGGAMSVSWPKMRQQIVKGRELKAEQK
jgi:competence protein ComGC